MKTELRIVAEIVEVDAAGDRVVFRHEHRTTTQVDVERITLNDKDVLIDICEAGGRTIQRLLKGRS